MKVFKDCGLWTIVQANLQTVNFIDVQVNLDTSIYQPYSRPDNNTDYRNKNSNHPTTVLKQLPKSIEKRISDISSNKYVLSQSIPMYQDTLQKSGFIEQIK